ANRHPPASRSEVRPADAVIQGEEELLERPLEQPVQGGRHRHAKGRDEHDLERRQAGPLRARHRSPFGFLECGGSPPLWILWMVLGPKKSKPSKAVASHRTP